MNPSIDNKTPLVLIQHNIKRDKKDIIQRPKIIQPVVA